MSGLMLLWFGVSMICALTAAGLALVAVSPDARRRRGRAAGATLAAVATAGAFCQFVDAAISPPAAVHGVLVGLLVVGAYHFTPQLTLRLGDRTPPSNSQTNLVGDRGSA